MSNAVPSFRFKVSIESFSENNCNQSSRMLNLILQLGLPLQSGSQELLKDNFSVVFFIYGYFFFFLPLRKIVELSGIFLRFLRVAFTHQGIRKERKKNYECHLNISYFIFLFFFLLFLFMFFCHLCNVSVCVCVCELIFLVCFFFGLVWLNFCRSSRHFVDTETTNASLGTRRSGRGAGLVGAGSAGQGAKHVEDVAVVPVVVYFVAVVVVFIACVQLPLLHIRKTTRNTTRISVVVVIFKQFVVASLCSALVCSACPDNSWLAIN